MVIIPWITSKDGYRVLVDQEDFDLYGHYVWRNKGTKEGGRNGILYRTVEKTSNRSSGSKRNRKEVQLHRLIAQAAPGQSVHHKNENLWDCRRNSLVVYDTLEEHLAAEHPWRMKKERPNASTVREGRFSGEVDVSLPFWESREPVSCR